MRARNGFGSLHTCDSLPVDIAVFVSILGCAESSLHCVQADGEISLCRVYVILAPLVAVIQRTVVQPGRVSHVFLDDCDDATVA